MNTDSDTDRSKTLAQHQEGISRRTLLEGAGWLLGAGGAWAMASAAGADSIATTPHRLYLPLLAKAGMLSGLSPALSSSGGTVYVAASNASPKSKESADYVCDGVDDQAEVQAAIDSIPATGGMVSLSEGTFNITSSAMVHKDNVAMSGVGWATVLMGLSPMEGVVTVVANRCIIRGLAIDGSGVALRGVEVLAVDHFSAGDLFVRNTTNAGVRVRGDNAGKPSRFATIVGNQFVNAGAAIANDYEIEEVTVVGNVVFDSHYGVTVYPFSTGHVPRITIMGNFIRNVREGVWMTNGARGTCVGNYIQGAEGAKNGISIAGAGDSVVGNNFIAGFARGIDGANAKRCLIMGNQILSCVVGILLDVNSGNNAFALNRLEDVSTPLVFGGSGHQFRDNFGLTTENSGTAI
ncbi:MAG: hypothetical protein HW403_1452, partial [Dehalococcoidia bacterium]|nr:hypothetical protein [Dehalococcoidia bacterium]